MLRHAGPAGFASRVPGQLIRWEADYGWTRRGYGQVAEKETALAVPLARLLATPDMWRTFAESYLEALDATGRAGPKRPAPGTEASTRTAISAVSAPMTSPSGMRCSWSGSRERPRTTCWTGSSTARRLPGRDSPSCARRSRRAVVTSPSAAALVTEYLKELPGHARVPGLRVEVGAALPPRAREMIAERARSGDDAARWRS